jgi:hypothetical protein
MKTLLLLLAVLSFSVAHAEDDVVTLNPIISEGSAAESLKFDPIVPAFQGQTKARASTGDITKDIANDLPFHSDSNLLPGNETNFTGIGKGPEETDVSVLGIPINRPQGGGADLGAFPQYFWSGYSYQIGPSLGAFDPRGVGGSLNLRLWTEDAMTTEQSRATGLWSSRGDDVEQFSYGWANGKTALLAGVTTGTVFGPALAFSSRPVETGSFRLTTHLVFSEVQAKDFVSARSGSTTSGEQTSYRFLPVIQLDKKMDSGNRLKSTFFYDLGYVRYVVAGSPGSKQIKKTHQLGNETAFITGDTRVGFGVRHLDYERAALEFQGAPPSEQTVNAQVSHAFHAGTLTVEPTVGGYAVTRKGAYPMASLGARNETRSGDSRFGQFLRAGFTKRAPSLLDRYYEAQYQVSASTALRAVPNPGLEPENVRSVEAGVDSSNTSFKNQLTLFARDYKHARYTRFFMIDPPPAPTIIGFQIQNAGNAYVYGFTGSSDGYALPILTLGARLTRQRSKIYDLGERFANTPEWVWILKADLHTADGKYGLEIVDKDATDFITYNESNGVVPLGGYNYFDVFARAEIMPGTTLVAGVEDVGNSQIVFRPQIPTEGRIYTLSLQSIF